MDFLFSNVPGGGSTGGSLTGTDLTLTSGTVTSSSPVFSWTQTWNNSGVTFIGVSWAVTDTASAAASKIHEVTVGGSGVYSLRKNGVIAAFAMRTSGGDVETYGSYAAASTQDVSDRRTALGVNFAGVRLCANYNVGWSANTAGAGDCASADTALGRTSAGILEVNDGSTNLRDLKVRAIRHNGQTFATLPTGVAGMTAYVTDSTVNTWGSTIAGGGANKVLAFYNGTNWTVAGA